MYNLVFQMVGDVVLLVGLLVLAYSPMAYFVVGRYFRVTRPMTDSQLLRVVTWIGRVNTVACVVAGTLIGYFMPVLALVVFSALGQYAIIIPVQSNEAIVYCCWPNPRYIIGRAFVGLNGHIYFQMNELFHRISPPHLL